MRARSGYEILDDGMPIYEIAQWFPRMAPYTDNDGWQNKQFKGGSEFALEFGDYVGFEQAMPHLSNSAYSTHHTAHGAAKAPPPVQHFMAEFYSQNQLDYELYLWALERHGLQAAYAPLVSQAVAFE